MVDRKGYRWIEIAGCRWQWRAGKSSVIARAESGERRIISFVRLTGWTAMQIEKMKWKHSLAITPGMVADWLRGSEVGSGICTGGS